MDKRTHVHLQAETSANSPEDYIGIIDASYGSTNAIARVPRVRMSKILFPPKVIFYLFTCIQIVA